MGDDDNARACASLRPPTRASGCVALVIAVGLLVHLRAWSFLCDDAFISFRYASNLARHGALVYNVEPLERVEGYTNFLWVLVLAAGDAIGLRPETLAPILTAGASLASLGLVALIGAALRRRFGPGQPDQRVFGVVDLLAPALLVLTPEFVVWASSGLETSLALALANKNIARSPGVGSRSPPRGSSACCSRSWSFAGCTTARGCPTPGPSSTTARCCATATGSRI